MYIENLRGGLNFLGMHIETLRGGLNFLGMRIETLRGGVGSDQHVILVIAGLTVRHEFKLQGPCCILEQETVPALLSTGWLQEQIPV